jgi:hypothetical protein
MSAKVTWSRGGEAAIVTLAGDAITLRSSVPSPPGSRIEGTLEGGDTLRVKVHSSKKQDDGAFVIEGRALDMTRALRERLTGSDASRATSGEPREGGGE